MFRNRITQMISDALWAMLRNDLKYILKYVSWFVSIILNFHAFCDAYTVERHCTVLLKSNKIICLILRRIFGNYILMVSNEAEDQLRLNFVWILNHLPIYEDILL